MFGWSYSAHIIFFLLLTHCFLYCSENLWGFFLCFCYIQWGKFGFWGWMFVMMEGDSLRKQLLFLPYWLFPRSETAQTAETIKWGILLHGKLSISFSSCLIPSTNHGYSLKLAIHHTSENRGGFLCRSPLWSKLRLKNIFFPVLSFLFKKSCKCMIWGRRAVRAVMHTL